MASPAPRPVAIDKARPGTIARLLAEHAATVARAVLLSPTRRSSAGILGTDKNGDDWLIRLGGHKQGLCLNLSTPEHTGDMLVFLTWARFGGDRLAAHDWARAYLRQLQEGTRFRRAAA